MTRNFTSAIPSIDAALLANEIYGSKRQHISIQSNSAGGTAALATCGSVTGYRYPASIPFGSVGAGVAAFMPTNMPSNQEDTPAFTIAMLEYNLGNINLATGAFTAGVTMPTKTIFDTSVQTAGAFVFFHCDNAFTATTPTIVSTYTNQDNIGSRSSSLVLPTNPIANSAFFMQPHLQNNDTGVIGVTNMTKSAGTVGTGSIRTGIPLAISASYSSLAFSTNFLQTLLTNMSIDSGETVAFYRFFGTSSSELSALINLAVEPL